MMKSEKVRKILFIGFIAVSFLAIWLFNLLTPYISDDLLFIKEVESAKSLKDLFHQQYEMYMTANGRAVLLMFVRLSFCIDKSIFNIINSIIFISLTLLMYYNVEKKEKYDVKIIVFITVLVWLFGIYFGQTVLWVTGACNYLWGTTLILGFVSFMRYLSNKTFNGKGQLIIFSIVAVLLGVLAGWCNENTSGGGILLVAAFLVYNYLQKKHINISMLCGLTGMVAGFLLMILAPGYRNRALWMEDEYTGILKYLSRFYKCTLEIREQFFILFVLFIIFFIVARMQKVKWIDLRNAITFMLVGIATCYAIVLSPTPMPRVYFGAGIFFIIACVQTFMNVKEDSIYIPSLKLSLISILSLYMVFVYVDDGMNVARIAREFNEREAYILEQKAAGETEIVVPMLRPQFETEYSFGYESDIKESEEFWLNSVFAYYYGVDSIIGVPREGWEKY